MKAPENIEKFLKKFYMSEQACLKSDSEKNKQIIEDAVSAYKKTLKKRSEVVKHRTWRTIMKNRATKLAAAAVIIVAIIICINYFGVSIDGTSIAWGKLAEKIEQTETVSYRMQSSTKTENTTTETLIRQSSQYGMRMDTFEGSKLSAQTYTLPQEKKFIAIIHQTKKYIRKELKQEQLQEPKIEDPRKWLKSLLSEKYKKLGRKVIDGVEVEGIEVVEPQFCGRALADCRVQLWVDIENELPVQLVVETIPSKAKMCIKTVFDNFQWNVELDSTVFKPPVIPDDYTEWQMPKQWESRKKNR